MNLLCPSCQRMLQVPEQYAGQQMRCPLCNNIFPVPPLPAAPGLAPPPPPPAAPAPPLPDPVHTPPELPPAAPAPAPLALEQEVQPIPEPDPTKQQPGGPAAPPPPPGNYTRTKSIVLSPRVVPWIAPVALLVLFILSFFPWVGTGSFSLNAWSMGFGDQGHTVFIFYDLLLIVAVLVGIASLLMHLKLIPDTPQLRPLQRFRGMILVGLAGLALLLFFLFELVQLFEQGSLPLSFWGLLAFWTHLVAVVGALLQMWLELRGPALPAPRLDMHW
jgi:hypothetical protein